MNRKELSRRATELLRDNDVRKFVSIPKQVFHISDDEGNVREFSVKKPDRKVLYTVEDVEQILDALLSATHESLRRGEPVTIRGFGTLGLKYRKSRELVHVGTGEETFAEARYLPKFTSGSALKLSAKLYEVSLDGLNESLPVYPNAVDDDGE